MDRQMKHSFFPIVKTLRFLWSTSLLTLVLFTLSYTATDYYFPSENDSIFPISYVLSMYFIIALSCFITELLFKGITNIQSIKWLHSPWMYFLAITLLLAVFCYFAWMQAAQPIQHGSWLDYTTLPLSAVLYCLFRQIFGLFKARTITS